MPPHPAGLVRLSVVIACLDAQDTIGVQLEALARQVLPLPDGAGWEVLVCDNGSTDRTLEVVQGYRSRLPLRVIHASARRGAGAARNAGARAASGTWLAFCDADDEVAPGWVAAMADGLRRHAFVAGRFDSARLNGRRARRSRPVDQTTGLQRSSGLVDLPHAGAGNMGMHRELFLSLGGFDPEVRCLEDTDLSWRAQRAGAELVYLPEAVVHVRLRSTLPAMYAQGRAYGGAHAALESRYAAPASEGGGRPASSAGLRAWLAGRPSLGRLVWQLGWHRGHRSAALLEPARGAGALAEPTNR